MATVLFTTRIIDAIARVCIEAIGPDAHAFAAGITDEVTELEPLVVPLADDFTEAGMPAVTLALGPWTPLLQPGNERLTFDLQGAVWRPRVPLGQNTNALYADRDALADAFMAHARAFEHEPAIQSAVLMGGSGIRARAVPRGVRAEGAGDRLFLTLPFSVQVKCNRQVVAQPA